MKLIVLIIISILFLYISYWMIQDQTCYKENAPLMKYGFNGTTHFEYYKDCTYNHGILRLPTHGAEW